MDKPCPFCGSRNLTRSTLEFMHAVGCNDCGASVLGGDWNRRTSLAEGVTDCTTRVGSLVFMKGTPVETVIRAARFNHQLNEEVDNTAKLYAAPDYATGEWHEVHPSVPGAVPMMTLEQAQQVPHQTRGVMNELLDDISAKVFEAEASRKIAQLESSLLRNIVTKVFHQPRSLQALDALKVMISNHLQRGSH